MKYLVTLLRGEDANAYADEIRSMGGAPRVLTSRIVEVEGLSLNTLRRSPEIKAIEQDRVVSGSGSYTLTPDFSEGSWPIARSIRRNLPWRTNAIHYPIETFYDPVRSGDGVDIYVIDTGFRLTHSEIAGRATNVWEGVSSGGLGDDNGHGTAIASAAAGLTVGISPSSLLWSFKVLGADSTGNLTTIIEGIGRAITHYNDRSDLGRPAVMNVSILVNTYSSSLEAIVEDAIEAGIVVLACAGNNSVDLAVTPFWPAMTNGVVCVGGTNPVDGPYYAGSFGTNYGARVDLLAPSQRCYMALRTGDNDFGLANGTSYGTGYASGVVAAMLEGHPRLAGSEVPLVVAKLKENATVGKFRPGPGIPTGGLPDRILYFDPTIAYEDFDDPTEVITEPVTELYYSPPEYVATGTNAGSNAGGSASPTIPSGVVAGDLLILTVGARGSGWNGVAVNEGGAYLWHPMSVVTLLGRASADSYDTHLLVFYKWATGSDSDPTLTPSITSGFGARGQVSAWRGVNPEDPMVGSDFVRALSVAEVTSVVLGSLPVQSGTTPVFPLVWAGSTVSVVWDNSGGWDNFDSRSTSATGGVIPFQALASGESQVTKEPNPSVSALLGAARWWAVQAIPLRSDEAPPSQTTSGIKHETVATGLSVSGSTTSVTCDAPSGIEPGDLLVAALGIGLNGSAVVAPSGWSLVQDAPSGNAHGLVYYKVASGSEPSTYTWTWTGNTGAAVAIHRYSGVDGVSPVAASSVFGYTGNGTVARMPIAESFGVRGKAVAFGFSGWGASGPATVAGDWSLIHAAQTTTNSAQGVTIAGAEYDMLFPGAAGNGSFTYTGSRNRVSIVLILRPGDSEPSTEDPVVYEDPDYRSFVSGQVSTGTTVTLAKPAGMAEGDLLIAAVGGTGGSITGWDLVADTVSTGWPNNIPVYSRKATSGDVAASDLVLTFSGSAARSVMVMCFENAEVSGAASGGTVASSTNHSAPRYPSFSKVGQIGVRLAVATGSYSGSTSGSFVGSIAQDGSAPAVAAAITTAAGVGQMEPCALVGSNAIWQTRSILLNGRDVPA